jgi:TPR repeat protein
VYDARRALPTRSAGRRPAGTLQKLLIASVFAVPPAYFIAKSHALPGFDFAASALGSLEAQVGALLPAPKPSRSQLARAPQQVAAAPIAETRTMAVADFTAAPADAHAGDAEAVATPPAAAEPRTVDVASLPAEPPSPPRDNPPADPPTNPPAEVGTAQPTLSARDIAILVERGRAFFEAGDLAAARLLFRRAANAGDAAAALAMGATYDPVVLADRLVRGLGADAEQARNWYEKARELGSPEGPRRLEMLAHR